MHAHRIYLRASLMDDIRGGFDRAKAGLKSAREFMPILVREFR